MSAVESAFGADIDYAMLIKLYGNAPEGGEVRYSPAQCMGARKAVQNGKTEWKHISTSFVQSVGKFWKSATCATASESTARIREGALRNGAVVEIPEEVRGVFPLVVFLWL